MTSVKERFSKTGTPEKVQGNGIFIAEESRVRHLVENGSLVYTWLDLETTDKEWQTLEITVASLTTTDIAYNMLADELYEVCVPDRNVLSPEAMAITRYTARNVRNKKKMSPQIAAARIFEDVQAAPFRLWNMAGEQWRTVLGEDLWREYIDEKIIQVPKKSVGVAKGQETNKDILVRHYPVLNAQGHVVKTIRMHEPSEKKQMMDMSYLVQDNEACDYEDECGRWRIRQMDKFNLGFRNTYFDNRALAGRLFAALFPHSELYALNKKGLGNHAIDVFTLAVSNYFFGTGGEADLVLGSVRDPETNWEKVSAKLDLIMENNTRFQDDDSGHPPGVRVWDGTLHNIRKGHNKPDYDNAKSIGVHRHLRKFDPSLVTHIERLGNIEYFREFLNAEVEDDADFPTTHPIRFIITTGDDDKIYRAVPVMILGSDDMRGKFSRIWAIRLDQDYEHYRYDEGKLLTELTADELAHVIRTQRGQPNAIFHEIHLKRHRGVVDLKTGLKAGLCPDMTVEDFRRRRDVLLNYIDEENVLFISKAMDAWEQQYAFQKPPADDFLPYVEEELWTAMGDVKYPYVMSEQGEKIYIPRVIRDMAQDAFKRQNARIGDNIRALIRPHPVEWDPTIENGMKYARLREKVADKLDNYQQRNDDVINLPPPFYDPEITSKKYKGYVELTDILATVRLDKLTLMAQLRDTTRSYEVQILRSTLGNEGGKWQTIPFEDLTRMKDAEILALKDEERLRIKFEENPSHPTLRFGIRYAMENGFGNLLSEDYKKLYDAETAFYIHGPPFVSDPDSHRMMSVPKARLGIERMRNNLVPHRNGKGVQISALRDGEIGAYDIFLGEDMANAIIASVENDARRLMKTYLFDDKKKHIMGIDPVMNYPYSNIECVIPEKHHIIRVPEGVTDKPVSDKVMGHACIAIPYDKRLSQAKHIVLEESKTGRKFYAADHILNDMPPGGHGSAKVFRDKAQAAYSDAGAPFPEEAKVLSCKGFYPISKMRRDPHPIIHVNQNNLLATRAPTFAGLQRNDPITCFVVRQYDYKLRKEQKIRLRGVGKDGQETGWEAIARIASKPQEISLKEILKTMEDNKTRSKIEKLAYLCGYANIDDMKDHLLAEFTRFDEDILDPENKLYFFEVKAVKKLSHWTAKQPKACFQKSSAGRKKKDTKPSKKYRQLERKPTFPPKSKLG